MFPMKVKKVSLDHRGGTKSYHLVLIRTADHRAIVINRWGKKGAWGSLKVEQYADAEEGYNAYSEKEAEKANRGYTIVAGKSDNTVETLDQLLVQLGAYWAEFGKANAEWLIPGVDTSKIKEPKEKKFVEVGNGRFVEEKAPPRLVPDPPVDPLEEARNNAEWGIY